MFHLKHFIVFISLIVIPNNDFKDITFVAVVVKSENFAILDACCTYFKYEFTLLLIIINYIL